MTVIQGLLLGVLQGVAEFLPISSSGHLALVQNLFGLEDVPLLYDVFLHLATLAAVVLYFRKKIWKLLKILGRWIARKPRPEGTENYEDELCGTDKTGRKTIIAIIITTAITGVMGIVTSKIIPDLSIKFTCAGFLVTAFLLIISSEMAKHKRAPGQGRFFKNMNADAAPSTDAADPNSAASVQPAPKGVSIIQSVIIGVMQGVGTLPGISRSGSTIAGALYSGVDQKSAGDYSFIVSIPAILGAFILELKDLGEVKESIGAAPVIAGCAAAFAVGYVSLVLLMKVLKKGKLQWFAAYLIPVGVLGLLFLK